MATINDNTDDKDKDKEANNTLLPGAAPSATGMGAPTTPQSKPFTGSGQFQDVRKFLQQNAPGAQALSGAVTSKVGQQASSVREGIQQAKGAFGQASAGAQSRESGAGDFISGAINQAKSGQQLQGGDLDRFQKLRTGYMENIAPQDMSQLQSQGGNLEQLGQQSGTYKGQYNLLRNTLGLPTYTGGQQRLDALLIGQTPGARQSLVAGTQGATKGLGGAVSAEQQAQQNQLAQLQQGARQYQTQATGQLGSELGAQQQAFQASIAQRQADRNAQLTQQKQALKDAWSGGDFSKAQDIIKQTTGGTGIDDATMKQLQGFGRQTTEDQMYGGLSDEEKTVMRNAEGKYGFEKDYLKNITSAFDPTGTISGTQATSAQLATPEERARFQALGGLAGSDLLQNYGDVGKIAQDTTSPAALGGLGQYSAAGIQAQLPGMINAQQEFQKKILPYYRDSAQNQVKQNQAVMDIINSGAVGDYKAGQTPTAPSIDTEALAKKYGFNQDWANDARDIALGIKQTGDTRMNPQFDQARQAALAESARIQEAATAGPSSDNVVKAQQDVNTYLKQNSQRLPNGNLITPTMNEGQLQSILQKYGLNPDVMSKLKTTL